MSSAKIASFVSGAEGAPWIVLSNSLGATHRMWQPQLSMLERSYRVLRYDTRGHGDSETPPAPYDFDKLVADALAVMDDNGVERATFVGLSLGGMTALGMGLNHADRIEKVVCCAARADAPPPFVQSWDDRLAVVDKAGVAGLWSGTLERWLTAEFQAANPQAVELLREDFCRTTDEGYRGCAAALKGLDYLRSLGSMTVPTMFVAGAEDLAAPPAAMRQMADATPGSRFEEIPDAGHILNMDNAAAFNDVLADFLGKS